MNLVLTMMNRGKPRMVVENCSDGSVRSRGKIRETCGLSKLNR